MSMIDYSLLGLSLNLKTEGAARFFRLLLHCRERLNYGLNLFVVHLNSLRQPRELLDQFARRGH